MFNYIMFSNLINELCEPLIQQTPVDHFGYVEIDSDGGVLLLGSDPLLLKSIESKNLMEPIIKYLTTQQNAVGKYHIDLKNSGQLEGKISLVAHELNLNHCLMIVKHGVRNNRNVIKYFIFTSSLETEFMTNYYFNNLETIHSFTKYIEKKVKNLLYSKRKVTVPEVKELFSLPGKRLEPTLLFNDLPQASRFTHLTSRELEIIAIFVNNSATARDTATNLNISVRTVEKHWENIREKLNYVEKSDVKKIFSDILDDYPIENSSPVFEATVVEQ